ncbi:hypothetical protein Hanom_Chr01g00060661 [Helianthus anomalus]
MNKVGPSRIKIRNLTKNSSWTYQPNMYLVPEDDAFEDGDEVVVVWLSHWMFGKNEFEDGDKYGISPVYDDGKQKEDALGYYKSWKHIIGGDLSVSQVSPSHYLLKPYPVWL